MRQVSVKGVVFKLLSWDFVEDGDMGGIYFLVPKGIYNYVDGGNNGAYVWVDDKYPNYDRARAACSCFDVNGVTEERFMERTLQDIVQGAAEFVNFNISKINPFFTSIKPSVDDEFNPFVDTEKSLF
ncbi:hypothetical protein [Clostridium sp.]|uniref:hypothetical protein n=1 Tax=Clostridium sp. TaxID=1506 RepID=UPI002612D174|nr:hypothetical protein [uncultured Clostridium sp.]